MNQLATIELDIGELANGSVLVHPSILGMMLARAAIVCLESQ